jgi:hypothetical protein
MTSAAVGGGRRQQQLKISKLDACSQVHICSAQSSTNHKRHDWPSNTKRRREFLHKLAQYVGETVRKVGEHKRRALDGVTGQIRSQHAQH